MNINHSIFLLLVNSAIYVVTDKDICAGLPKDEIIPFPHETDCSKYYECFNGKITENKCPDDLYYNPKTQMCDFPDASGCDSFDLLCLGKDLDYLPYPADCSKYVECYLGNSYLMACPKDFWFDSLKKMCTLPENSDCGKITSESTTSTTPSWTTPHPICWGVRPSEVLLLPYPDDCSKYYRCDGANLSVESCPAGLFFDESTQSCDFPDIAGCALPTTTPEYPVTTDPNVTPVTPPDWNDPRCDSGDISYWPHPVLCDKYIECYKGHGYEMNCPSGLFFEDSIKKCVIPSLSDCGRTTIPPTSTYIPPHPDCEYNGQLLPYPGDCTKFYECALGKKVEMSCPDDLWFNTDINECDYPYQTKCEWSLYNFLLKFLY